MPALNWFFAIVPILALWVLAPRFRSADDLQRMTAQMEKLKRKPSNLVMLVLGFFLFFSEYGIVVSAFALGVKNHEFKSHYSDY